MNWGKHNLRGGEQTWSSLYKLFKHFTVSSKFWWLHQTLIKSNLELRSNPQFLHIQEWYAMHILFANKMCPPAMRNGFVGGCLGVFWKYQMQLCYGKALNKINCCWGHFVWGTSHHTFSFYTFEYSIFNNAFNMLFKSTNNHYSIKHKTHIYCLPLGTFTLHPVYYYTLSPSLDI